MTDPHGYDRLARGLDFLASEMRSVDLDSEALESARRFRFGSPTEFLGESLVALESVLDSAQAMAPSLRAFAVALAEEIRSAFKRIGGG